MGQPEPDPGDTLRGPRDLVARLDRIMAELAELRAELAAAQAAATDSDDTLLDTASAGSRFNYAPDSIRKMCREVPGLGVWKGGHWHVRVGEMRRHLDRKNGQSR